MTIASKQNNCTLMSLASKSKGERRHPQKTSPEKTRKVPQSTGFCVKKP